jgi:predicted transposase/invertase (TIGR01784 family)
VSLAILGDERETWRPQPWEAELWGCRVQFEFPTIKLLDYRTRWEELESSRNPFAIAVMAHLKTKETRDNASTRKEWKFRLTKRLYEQGYERKDILNLFRFIDWMLELPASLKQAFRDELEQYEQERQMPYVTSIEQMGIEKGREEGREEERQEIALNLLRQHIALETIAEATGLTIEHLQQLQAQVELQDG